MEPTDGSIVTAVCKMCGRMQIDTKYYNPNGNAVTNFIVCEECKK